jgi:hypothetical protein
MLKKILMCLSPGLILGLILALTVNITNYYKINGMCNYTGFWGCHYFDSLLYAFHSPQHVMIFVSVLYFFYGLLIGSSIMLVFIVLNKVMKYSSKNSNHGNNGQVTPLRQGSEGQAKREDLSGKIDK